MPVTTEQFQLLMGILCDPFGNPGEGDLRAHLQRLYEAENYEFALSQGAQSDFHARARDFIAYLHNPSGSSAEAIRNARQNYDGIAAILDGLTVESLWQFVNENPENPFWDGDITEGVNFKKEYIAATGTQAVELPIDLPPEFLRTNDVAYMTAILQENQEFCSKDTLRYMRAHLAAAKHLQALKANRGNNKRMPAANDVVVSDDGNSVQLPNVHMSRNQTAAQGCWSVALQLMLQSRGIELPQEYIRAYRSNEKADELGYTNPQEDCFDHPEDYFDATSNPQNRADLIFQTLPNTAIINRDYTFPNEKDRAGKAQSTDEAQISRQIFDDVFRALKESRSPVALLFHGHYRTVVGADKNTKEILFKDPMGTAPDGTYRMKMPDLVQYIRSHPDNERDQIGRGSISISYLKDLDFTRDASLAVDAHNGYQNGQFVSSEVPEFVDPSAPKYGTKLTRGILDDAATKFEVTENAYYPHQLQQLGNYRPIAPAERISGTKARIYAKGMPEIHRFEQKDVKKTDMVNGEDDIWTLFAHEPQSEPSREQEPQQVPENDRPADNMPPIAPAKPVDAPQRFDPIDTADELTESARAQSFSYSDIAAHNVGWDCSEYMKEIVRLNGRMAINRRASDSMKAFRTGLDAFVREYQGKTLVDRGLFVKDFDRVMDLAGAYRTAKAEMYQRGKSFSRTQIHRLKTLNYLSTMQDLMKKWSDPIGRHVVSESLLATKLFNAAALAGKKPDLLCQEAVLRKSVRQCRNSDTFDAFVYDHDVEKVLRTPGIRFLNEYGPVAVERPPEAENGGRVTQKVSEPVKHGQTEVIGK